VYSKAETKELIKLGELIRKRRIKLKLSQAQLAFELGTDGRHIRRIEKGEVNISYLTLNKICIALNISDFKTLFV
jgi:transcriptional regulator with XRE-family HTH domain